ncbi:MAG: acyl-CoA dehydrogenase [Oceanospirillales bacterium]|uniref:3-methylmercaptopropionyl-CoA dehydrogenase n=1 Tax=Marinobacterium halophilum TaxID=267374 RepID=A0A2P8EVD6_9GAMM|nr:acyl-CoA dehydrogenase C-terminal domain-containing protein [Marinobacterium halophilum]MBR9828824.1 acyl-CoA dehydrogenase [Oceanospirillales bacterium]PSL13431.1 alkylation response protein AidB-like acyl-CoA dehydrogenase [Marinobacterium halophilum]
MADYNAPLKDMKLTLNHVARMPELAEKPGFEDASADMVDAILEEAARVARDVVAPTNWEGDQQGVQLKDGKVACPDSFKQAYQQYVEGGWGSLQFDPEYGGQGLPFLLSIPVMEMWHSANMAWGLCPMLSQGAVECLDLNGSDELKAKYLPKLVSGEWCGTMNLTESNAGSDLSVVRAKAEPEGDHYRVSGEKIFITWGDHEMAENIVHLVLARLPDAPAGVRGISLFLVPKYLVNDDGSLGERNTAGALSLEHKLGIHASPTCVMGFDNAIGYLVGEPNRGLACMFTMMNNARLSVGLQGVSISERAYQQALEYAFERIQGPAVGTREAGPIIRHADVRRMLLTMKTLTEAGRGIAYDACGSLDFALKATSAEEKAAEQARAALLTPIVKGWCTEVAQEVTSLGVQVYGGMGYIEETGAAQHFRDARILPIYEGTNGIQALDLVGRKTLMDQGAALAALIEEIRGAIASCDPSLIAQAKQLEEGVVGLTKARDFLLSGAEADAQLPGAIAYNFMMLAGYVCGGWQLLRQATAAVHLAAEGDDDPYLQAKQESARFYMAQVLPRWKGFADMLNDGSRSIMALPEELFASAWQ